MTHTLRRTAATLAAAALLAGCATVDRYQPIVDVHPGDRVAYERDLAECRNLARQLPDPMHAAIAGALIGAALGAALGHAGGFDGAGRQALAGTGAVAGSVAGGAEGHQSIQDVVRRCLVGRGWRVLR